MVKRTRILFTIPNFITAGSGREMFNIIEGLDKIFFDPIIAVQQAGGQLYDEIIAKGYTIVEHKFIEESQHGLANKLRAAGKNSQFFKQYNIDIWQSFHWSSDFTEALTALWCGAKYVYVKKNMNWNRKAWKVKSFLARAIIARNKTLVNGAFNNWLYKAKTHFITGAVDANRFQPGNSNFRNSLDIPAEIKIVLCVAQLIKIKDQLTLIKAIAKTENTYLVLVGAMRDEEYLQEVKDLVSKLKLEDRVQLHGYGNDTAHLVNGSDVFVLSTSKEGGHEEGCPVALLEAMACGGACIASNVAGSNDLIIDNKTGLLFEPGNDTQLAEQITRIISDKQLAQNLGTAARKKVLAEHTLPQELAAFTRVYKQLAGIA
ncbi:MAG: glycosyltransferase family 1 protein [Sphingobacteriales bacterium]|nr:MAG: glycosyltransferase family 1 protein [Sphingobacteriales bacterium]